MSRSKTQHSDSPSGYTQASNPLISRLTLYQLSEPLLYAFQCTSCLACFERLEVQPLRLGAIICNISVFTEKGNIFN